MTSIAGTQALYRPLAGSQRDIGAALRVASDRIGGAIQRSAGRDGNVLVERIPDITETSDGAIDDAFIGASGRPFASDGVTAQAPIPRAINKHYVLAVFGVILPHSAFIKAHTPDSVQTWLLGAKRPASIPGWVSMHDWIDPNGLILSDRIWQASIRTRLKLRGLITDASRQGTAATTLASRVEQFLLPGRAQIRTKKPYGTDASYDAMRLARTEIARAHGQATIAAVRQNPYAEKIAWRLSGSHPRQDPCDNNADNGPYLPDDVPNYPEHPHCLCYLEAVVTRSPSDVAAELRSDMERGESAPFTPANPTDFTELLIGAYLLNLIADQIKQAA